MNERIKQLADQAGFGLRRDGEIYTSRLEHLPITEDLAKFAELIVQECVSVINTEAGEREDDDEYERAWKMGTEFAVYQIKQHFGVEE